MDHSAIRLAAQHFIGKSDHEIEDAIKKTIAGHQRAIIGVLTVEELYRDRNAFSKRVLDLCHDDMRNMGLTVVSYTVAEISDENGYIEALGVTQTERVKREAKEGAATHQSKGNSVEAERKAEAHLQMNKQQERTIESNKLRSVTQANAQREVDVRVAIQKKAGLIADAEQDAVLFVERQKAFAAEVKAELDVLKQKVEKAKLTKQREVHVEADAMLYKSRVGADGIRATAMAEADRVKAMGEAEAAAIRAKGKAEIDVLRERVKVWLEWYVVVLSLFAANVVFWVTGSENLTLISLFLFQTQQRQPSGNSREDDRYSTKGCGCSVATIIKDREDGICRWKRSRRRSLCLHSRNGACLSGGARNSAGIDWD